MVRSKYVDSVVLTNNHSGQRTHKVQAFVIHHMAAVWTGRRCAESFLPASRGASANYCIGYNGDVCLNVEENCRAWTSSSNWADQRAITFELSNSSMGGQWVVSDATIRKCILMLAELHKKYGLKKCTYTGDTNGTLWRHDWFASTNCPGQYLGSKLSWIADEVNKVMAGGQVSIVKPTGKTDQQLADEVLAGLHGNGDARKKSLGSRYSAVQAIVNQRVSGKAKPQAKSDYQLAQEVLAGLHGNGQQRMRSLGSRYEAVQRTVNQLVGGKPVQKASKAKTLHLPKNVGSWKIYRKNGPYTVGHQIGYLAPSKFGGLTYEIKGSPMKDVYLIDTRDFGRVAIYAGSDTVAQIR